MYAVTLITFNSNEEYSNIQYKDQQTTNANTSIFVSIASLHQTLQNQINCSCKKYLYSHRKQSKSTTHHITWNYSLMHIFLNI